MNTISFVLIMCDWCAEGIWSRGGGSMCLEYFPIRQSLKDRIMAWQDWWQVQPTDESEDPAVDVEAFTIEGGHLALAVKAELPDWTVEFYDHAQSRKDRENDPCYANYEFERYRHPV